VEIVDPDDDNADVFAAYYAEGAKNTDRDPVYSERLGLAIETLRDGVTLENLWSVTT
jgi:Bardet-Biedl syndrome 5 protein